MLQVRVELQLVHGRLDFGGLQDCFDMRRVEVGHADALSKASLLELFHLSPGML